MVRVRFFRESDRNIITIADTAGGIPPDIMEQMFDPYFSTKGPTQGSGLGLFAAKKIIEKGMGGRLTASNISEGTEFRIEVQGEHVT